jgi:uncharacterized protein YgiM (DUF1202 family)
MDVAPLASPLEAAAPVIPAEPALTEVREVHPQPLLLADPEPPRPTEPPPRVERQVVTTAPSGANMRAAPSTSSAVLWKAPRGTSLQVIGEEGSWLQVAAPARERTGWIHRSVVRD